VGVNLKYLDNYQGVIFSCYGVSTGEELKEALRRVVKKESLENLKYALIDQTAVTSYVRTASDTIDFVNIQKYMGISVPDDAIVAVVAPSTLGYSLASVWEMKVSEVGWVTKIFKTKEEAEVWIRAKMKDQFDIEINFVSPEADKRNSSAQ